MSSPSAFLGLDTPRGRASTGAVTIVLACALCALWIGLRLGGGQVTKAFDDSATALAAFMAMAFCARAAVRNAQLRRFWSLMSAACACWTLAEIVWGWYEIVLRVSLPVVSWADVGYLSAIPVALLALLFHPGLHRNHTRQARWTFDGLIIASALTFLSWTLVFGPVWHNTDLSTAGGVVALAYPFGDVVIVFFILLAARRMSGSHLSLWFLLGGLLLMSLSDSAYSYLSTTNSYTDGNLIDVGWIAAYLTIALSAFTSCSCDTVTTRGEENRRPTIISFVAPVLPAVVALAVTGLQLQPGRHIDTVSRLIASALVGLVITRQGLLLAEVFTAPTETHEVGLMKSLVRTALGPKARPGAPEPGGDPRAGS